MIVAYRGRGSKPGSKAPKSAGGITIHWIRVTPGEFGEVEIFLRQRAREFHWSFSKYVQMNITELDDENIWNMSW